MSQLGPFIMWGRVWSDSALLLISNIKHSTYNKKQRRKRDSFFSAYRPVRNLHKTLSASQGIKGKKASCRHAAGTRLQSFKCRKNTLLALPKSSNMNCKKPCKKLSASTGCFYWSFGRPAAWRVCGTELLTNWSAGCIRSFDWGLVAVFESSLSNETARRRGLDSFRLPDNDVCKLQIQRCQCSHNCYTCHGALP